MVFTRIFVEGFKVSDIAVKEENGFIKGLKDGVPISLGYFPVAFAFAVAATKLGFPIWLAELMDALVYTGSGQFAVLNLIQGGETALFMYALTIFAINCRYILLSLALSQRLDPSVGVLQRMVFGFFNTDEIFAVATQGKGKLKAPYLFGVATAPYIGWAIGSLIGCLFTDMMPVSVSMAMGIILYAMFIAIIVPAVKNSRPVLWIVLISIVLSFVMECNPFVRKFLSAGWIIIICAFVSSLIGAVLFPISDEEEIE